MVNLLLFLRSQVIKDYQLFMVVGVLVFIDLAIMTTWQVADPFYRETKQMEPYVRIFQLLNCPYVQFSAFRALNSTLAKLLKLSLTLFLKMKSITM